MREDLPWSLLNIVGEESPIPDSEPAEAETSENPVTETGVDVLLSKPANPEQERVIRRLATTGSVLVQGPPGTGKTHTIANLVGHLLAQGKSNKEVATALFISVRTVETHRRTIFQKLEINAIAELVRFAIRQRLIKA